MKGEIKFLAEIKGNERVRVDVFVPQIYQIVIYFCERCKKNSERICDCGNFPEPRLKILGMISDGTKTMPFETVSENVAETLMGVKKSDAKKVRFRDIMKKPYILEGRMNKDRFWIEKVL